MVKSKKILQALKMDAPHLNDNTKSSVLFNLLRLDEARCFILDELLDKTTVQGRSAA